MLVKVYNLLQIMKSSLWLLPATFCLAYFGFTLLIYQLEASYFDDVELPAFFFSGTRSDAQDVTITLLSSMITMATLAISITMVVLSLAASQLGPRLIRTFMADRKTQCYIGLFFGTVIACFVLTMILHDTTPSEVSPQITTTSVFAMCFANMFVLLRFVHHVAQTSIADNIILKESKELLAALDRLTVSSRELHEDDPDQQSTSDFWPNKFTEKQKKLRFARHGYVQHIDYDCIAELCHEHNLYIEIHFKAGHFLVEGEDGLRVYPNTGVTDEIERKIKNAFIIGNTRTPTQDIEYSIRHLVEIALRALSPGMDDSFTGITVIDQLSAALSKLFKRQTPSEWIMDHDKNIRIWAKQSNETDLIFSAFDQIRHSARDKPNIIEHILKKFRILNELAQTDFQRKGIREQLKEIEFDIKHNLKSKVRNTGNIETLCKQLLNANKQ